MTNPSGLQVVATAQALLANGGVMSPVGMHTVAMAARRHSVPVVVLCGIYKLSTLFPHNPGGCGQMDRVGGQHGHIRWMGLVVWWGYAAV